MFSPQLYFNTFVVGTAIAKDELRFGTLVEFRGAHNLYVISKHSIAPLSLTMVSFNQKKNSAWRHWGCVTPKILENVQKSLSDPGELDGFEELNEVDKAKIIKAWQDGHVADEDIPDTARKPEGEEEEKPKKRAPAKKAAKKKDEDAEEGTEEEAEEKPKKKPAKRAPKKKDEDAEEGEDEVEEKPKKARATKKVIFVFLQGGLV